MSYSGLEKMGHVIYLSCSIDERSLNNFMVFSIKDKTYCLLNILVLRKRAI